MKEEITENGKGLAKVRKVIKTESMVTFAVSHWRDISELHDYNHEYLVGNDLFDNRSYSFDHYYDGGDIKGNAEKRFKAEVDLNNKIIQKVKNFIGSSE